MTDASREMTLAEWVERLPEDHCARKEYARMFRALRLICRIEDEATAEGITDATMRDVHRVATDEWPVPGAALPARRPRAPFIARLLANEFGVRPETIAADMATTEYVHARCGCPGPLEKVPSDAVARLLFIDAGDRIELARDRLGQRVVAWVYDAQNRIKTGIGIHCERCGCPTEMVAA